MAYKFPRFMTVSFSRQAANVKTGTAPKVPSPPPPASRSEERRINQRFIARLNGEPCFWAVVGKECLALDDISLKGFALPAGGELVLGAQFDFTLKRDGVPDSICGRAEVTSVFGKVSLSAGCRIVQFEGDGDLRLRDWLVAHVIRCATVRISEKDALAIVSGRSLV